MMTGEPWQDDDILTEAHKVVYRCPRKKRPSSFSQLFRR